MMLEKTFPMAPFLLFLALAASTALAQSQPVTLTIHADQPLSTVSPTLYGLMTEEINYSYDGGLYAEMVRNRGLYHDWTGVPYWYVLENGKSQAKLNFDEKTGPSKALSWSSRRGAAGG